MTSLNLMAAGKRFPRRFRSMLAVPALLVMASCGSDDGLGVRYPVSGTVTYNGKPLEKGSISFVADDLKKISVPPARLRTDRTLSRPAAMAMGASRQIQGDDHVHGRHSGQSPVGLSEGPGRENPKLPPQHAAKAAAVTKSLIPAGYGDARTTTLTAEVKPGSNTIPFTLSDQEAPPEPKAQQPSKARGRR